MPDRSEIIAIQSKLLQVLARNRRHIDLISGVHHADVGLKYVENRPTDKICIRLHVYKKHPSEFLKAKPMSTTIDGTPLDVVESHPSLDIGWGDKFSHQIIGGIPIGNPHINSRGTLGGVFRLRSGKIVGLTNHHVILDHRGKANDPVIQPSTSQEEYSRLVIGHVLHGHRALDCAVFELNESRAFSAHYIAGLDQHVEALEEPVVFDHVKKCGARTGVTFGTIEGVDEYGRITIANRTDKPNPEGKLSDGGDSGSIWLLDKEGSGVAVGLHYQGERSKTKAYAYGIRQIMSILNIDGI